jgi:hypothetical protein
MTRYRITVTTEIEDVAKRFVTVVEVDADPNADEVGS